MSLKPLFAALVLLASVTGAHAACTVGDIVIKSAKARVVKLGSRNYVKGVGVLTNRCAEPVGVQVQMTAYDRKGEPVATQQFWPASVSNVPPGDYTFTLDGYLDYEPEMKTFSVEPVSVRRWR